MITPTSKLKVIIYIYILRIVFEGGVMPPLIFVKTNIYKNLL